MTGSRAAVRRVAALVAGAFLLGVLVPAAVVSAAETERETMLFDYIKDRRAWYWEKQIDQEVRLPVNRPPALPPQVPTPSQRVRLPNPQQPDTLPVAAYGGEEERMSAIAFNLADRGVTEGSTIEKLVMTIEESQDRSEWPSFNVKAAKIEACRITEFWVSADDPETMTARPETTSDCVDGRRNDSSDVPVWTFDLTEIAAPWGESAFSNQGVLLSPQLPDDAGPADTWQVNLKIPAQGGREPSPLQPDPPTYEKTKRRVVVQLAFVPGEPPDIPTPDPVPTGTTTGTTTTFTPATSSGTPYGTTGSAVGSVATTGTTAPPEVPQAEAVAEAAPAAAPVAQTQPGPPPYVWLLLPLGLLGLSAVRSVVLEPTGGPRPDGAIAAIRNRNAARRGGPIREVRDPLAATWGAVRRGAGRTGAMFSKAVWKVRKR